MIVLLDRNLAPAEVEHIKKQLQGEGFWCHPLKSGQGQIALQLNCPIGVDVEYIRSWPGVQEVLMTVSSTPLVERQEKADVSLKVGSYRIGGEGITLMVGPCAVESRQQVFEVAHILKELQIPFMRGGAFKPRTSPYSFQGRELLGLEWMREAADQYDLKIISEVVSAEYIEPSFPYVDVFQVGARNAQNFTLLKNLSEQTHPVLLKRGMGATISEWLSAGEYLLQNKKPGVLFCERGIRTFETSYRFTFDINAIPYLRRATPYPVFADPSHACGDRYLIPKVACAAVAAGAQGLLLEFHPNASQALSDGAQALSLQELRALVTRLHKLQDVLEEESLSPIH